MRRFSIFLVLAIFLALAVPATGATINGSTVITSLGATIDGTDLSDSTLFTPATGSGFPTVTSGLPTGDYTTGLPINTVGYGGDIDTTNLTSYTIDFTGYGSFAATIGIIISQTASFADFYFLGSFLPEAGSPFDTGGFTPTATSVRISVNKTGESVSYSGTMASPPADLVPEPGTYALLGGGLIALFALRRRKA